MGRKCKQLNDDCLCRRSRTIRSRYHHDARLSRTYAKLDSYILDSNSSHSCSKNTMEMCPQRNGKNGLFITYLNRLIISARSLELYFVATYIAQMEFEASYVTILHIVIHICRSNVSWNEYKWKANLEAAEETPQSLPFAR